MLSSRHSKGLTSHLLLLLAALLLAFAGVTTASPINRITETSAAATTRGVDITGIMTADLPAIDDPSKVYTVGDVPSIKDVTRKGPVMVDDDDNSKGRPLAIIGGPGGPLAGSKASPPGRGRVELPVEGKLESRRLRKPFNLTAINPPRPIHLMDTDGGKDKHALATRNQAEEALRRLAGLGSDGDGKQDNGLERDIEKSREMVHLFHEGPGEVDKDAFVAIMTIGQETKVITEKGSWVFKKTEKTTEPGS